MAELTNEARIKAGKSQMYQYLNNQYIGWHMMAVASIRKLLMESDSFYKDILEDPELENVCTQDNIDRELKNGWLYEAVSHAEQAIEDLFSLLKRAQNVQYFARDVVQYNASEIKKYIWSFKVDDLKYITEQFHVPYFDIEKDCNWEHMDVFEGYKSAVLLMRDHLKDLVAFHRHYYHDYCQYKHGLSVSLRKESRKDEPLKGVLYTNDISTVESKWKREGKMPYMAKELFPKTQPYVCSLHDENNLLHYNMHTVDLDEVISITRKAFVLLNALRTNLMMISETSDDAPIAEHAFPCESEDLTKVMIIGFPQE